MARHEYLSRISANRTHLQLYWLSYSTMCFWNTPGFSAKKMYILFTTPFSHILPHTSVQSTKWKNMAFRNFFSPNDLTVNHRKTSNFGMCLLNFIHTCHFCFIPKIIHHLKRNWPRFSLPEFCRSSIYVITVVKIWL